MFRLPYLLLVSVSVLLLCGGCSEREASAASATRATSPDSAASAASATAVPLPPRPVPKILICGPALAEPAASYTVADFEAIGETKLAVFDPYWSVTRDYSGPLLRDVVKKFAPNAKHVEMTAIDDYRATFTAQEWQTLDIMVATRDQGSAMSVAEKGPIRVVIHHDDPAAIKPLRPKWIWQIIEIRFD
ncbi:MAG: molybdopterin-dependent oxidoreductase [Planctomycetota bacterium]